MNRNVLTDEGKLQKELLPAVYFDSSVVIDYYAAENFPDEEEKHEEIDLDEFIGEGKTIPDELRERVERQIELENFSTEFLLRDIINSDKRIKQVSDIRNKVLYEEIKVNPVISPLVMVEFNKWFTETLFKELASDAVGSKVIQRYGNNQIGNYLKNILDLINKKDNEESKWKKKALKHLKFEFSPSPSFIYAHGLRGLIHADITNFDLFNNRLWSELYMYSYLQMGATDIMHVLFAEHLGCEYLATFDEDFKRASDIIKKSTGITVLKGYKEIIDIF